MKDIQDLDMSPRSKHRTLEKQSKHTLSRGSYINESSCDELDVDRSDQSDHYTELRKLKQKADQVFGNFVTFVLFNTNKTS